MILFSSSDRCAAAHDGEVGFDVFLCLPLKSVLCSVISPFVLTRELLPVLKKTASELDSDVRVVVVRKTLEY